MNIKLALPTRLILGALLMAGFIAPPHAVPQTQDTSTASLADTLAWLVSFVPSATGSSGGVAGLPPSTETTQITGSNSCTITVVTSVVQAGGPGVNAGTGTVRYDFSLADIDPNSIRAIISGGFVVVMQSPTKSIRESTSFSDGSGQQIATDSVDVEYFNDQSGADRVANAFRHAVQLCAKPQLF